MPLSQPSRITVPLHRARRLATAALALVVLLELASGLLCGDRDAQSQLIALGFLLIPLSPALVALATPNPLCSVAAAAPVAAWIVYAFYFECVRPYAGGGASMIYLGVWFYGFLCAVAAALAAIPILRLLGIRVRAA
jgi:hypothetical protein